MPYFSPKTKGFYPEQLLVNFMEAGSFPDDAHEISQADYIEFINQPPAGKMLGNKDGKPAWVDIPAPTREEIIADAKEEKNRLIVFANNFMNDRQWPGKAAIGRLKDDELKKYNEWLDYLDALNVVDVEAAPDIAWPTEPL
ncbi:tail fiber assembly protein [Cronobacter sakazakii]|nr:tail fiber assembly protein [Cronobacter sakazakii]